MTDSIDRVAAAIYDAAYQFENVDEGMASRFARAAIEAYQAALWPPIDFGSRTLAIDRRRMRADALTAHVMHAISGYLCRHGDEDGAREASRALFNMFYEAGADIVTDLDRAIAGLAPRDHNGLTREELQIMEAKRTEAMLRPMSPIALS